MPLQDHVITCASVVNDVLLSHPATTNVFNEFGIDACCGGAVPIHDAALRDGADPAALLDALNAAVAGDRRGGSTEA